MFEEIERKGVHEYRAAARRWLFKWAAEETGYALYLATWTLKDTHINGSVVSEHDPEYALKVAVRNATASGLSGPVFVESGKRGGRIHAHGLVMALCEHAITEARNRFTGPDPAEPLYGFVSFKPVTDLLGAVHYVTKAFGPNSPVRWVNREKEWQRCLTDTATAVGGLVATADMAGSGAARTSHGTAGGPSAAGGSTNA